MVPILIWSPHCISALTEIIASTCRILFFNYLKIASVWMETVPLVDSNMTIQQGMEDIIDTGITCTFVNQTEDGYIFSCGEYNPMFAMLTLASKIDNY